MLSTNTKSVYAPCHTTCVCGSETTTHADSQPRFVNSLHNFYVATKWLRAAYRWTSKSLNGLKFPSPKTWPSGVFLTPNKNITQKALIWPKTCFVPSLNVMGRVAQPEHNAKNTEGSLNSTKQWKTITCPQRLCSFLNQMWFVYVVSPARFIVLTFKTAVNKHWLSSCFN